MALSSQHAGVAPQGARVLFSLLGRPSGPPANGTTPSTRYRLARYDFGDGDATPRAVFVVGLIEHLRRATRAPDRAVLFGTAQSIWAALVDLLPLDDAAMALFESLSAAESDAAPPSPGKLRADLDHLQRRLSEHLGIALSCELIPTLAQPVDQRTFLAGVRRHLAPGDTVLVDVTHGLGHQRILLAQTLVALETLHDVRVEALYSGALDLTDKTTERTPVVRLDGVLQSVRLDRAVAWARRAGDPSGLVEALPSGDPLRKPLQRLADAWRLNQPERIRSAATQVLGTLGNLPPDAQEAIVVLRDHLDEVARRHGGSTATQQFTTARAALERGDLLRASILLREACITVGCIATGHRVDDERARENDAKLWIDAQQVEYACDGRTDNAWRVLHTRTQRARARGRRLAALAAGDLRRGPRRRAAAAPGDARRAGARPSWGVPDGVSMSDPRRPWVLAYDVVDDDRRRRLAKYLEAHGHRVQDSVFELLATPEELTQVLDGAQKPERFKPAEDGLRCYPLCATCLGGARVVGRSAPVLSPGAPVVL